LKLEPDLDPEPEKLSEHRALVVRNQFVFASWVSVNIVHLTMTGFKRYLGRFDITIQVYFSQPRGQSAS